MTNEEQTMTQKTDTEDFGNMTWGQWEHYWRKAGFERALGQNYILIVSVYDTKKLISPRDGEKYDFTEAPAAWVAGRASGVNVAGKKIRIQRVIHGTAWDPAEIFFTFEEDVD